VDITDKRLQAAKKFGATHTINSTQIDPVQEILRITGAGVDYSLDCAGIPAVLQKAFESLAWGGVCGLIGAAPAGAQVSLDMQTLLNGRGLIGIVEGDAVSDVFIPQLIELYRQGRFPFDKMITFYPFEEINRAAEDSEKGKALKAILRF
jgi:aryl-alcohol dehydrogenase